MKIRTDYVTNSSSSSFIIGFCGDKSKWEVLRENLSDIFSDHLVDMLTENSTDVVGKDKIRSLFEYEYLGYSAKLKYEDKVKMEEKSLCDKADREGFDKFFVVNVDDHEIDGIVEHNVMPWLDCTLRQYSHH